MIFQKIQRIMSTGSDVRGEPALRGMQFHSPHQTKKEKCGLLNASCVQRFRFRNTLNCRKSLFHLRARLEAVESLAPAAEALGHEADLAEGVNSKGFALFPPLRLAPACRRGRDPP